MALLKITHRLQAGVGQNVPAMRIHSLSSPTYNITSRNYTSMPPKTPKRPSNTLDPPPSTKPTQKKPAPWRAQKNALRSKFKEGWAPPKRLSPDAIEGVRELYKQDPIKFSTPILAEQFKVSPEAVRRILRSKWRPTEKEVESRRIRWERRKERIWDHMSELGLRPQKNHADLSANTKVKRFNRDQRNDSAID